MNSFQAKRAKIVNYNLRESIWTITCTATSLFRFIFLTTGEPREKISSFCFTFEMCSRACNIRQWDLIVFYIKKLACVKRNDQKKILRKISNVFFFIFFSILLLLFFFLVLFSTHYNFVFSCIYFVCICMYMYLRKYEILTSEKQKVKGENYNGASN